MDLFRKKNDMRVFVSFFCVWQIQVFQFYSIAVTVLDCYTLFFSISLQALDRFF